MVDHNWKQCEDYRRGYHSNSRFRLVCVERCLWRHSWIGGVVIGDNVFIGMKSTILKGVHIGNNVIIGANSLVNKDIPDNCVAAGNPCKVIMGLEEYHEKRKAAQVVEAKELVELYRERYGKEPDEKALHEFFWLLQTEMMNFQSVGKV